MSGERNFDRLLDIQEKSIVAWEREFEKLEHLEKIVAEIITTDKKFTLWLKIMTGIITFVTTVAAGIITIREFWK